MLRSLREPGPLRVGIAAAAVIAALLAAWAQWQPQRSADASQEALALSARDPTAARSAAQAAVDSTRSRRKPCSRSPTIQQHAGQTALARATLVRAVHLQPSNPQTWQALGEYDLRTGDPTAALNELRAAVYLNPEAVAPLASDRTRPGLLAIQNDYLQALRAAGTAAATSDPTARKAAHGQDVATVGAESAPGMRDAVGAERPRRAPLPARSSARASSRRRAPAVRRGSASRRR